MKLIHYPYFCQRVGGWDGMTSDKRSLTWFMAKKNLWFGEYTLEPCDNRPDSCED